MAKAKVKRKLPTVKSTKASASNANRAKSVPVRTLMTAGLTGESPVPLTRKAPVTDVSRAKKVAPSGALPTVNAVPAGTMPTATAMGAAAVPTTATVAPSTVPKADNINQQIDLMEMEIANPAVDANIYDLEIGGYGKANPGETGVAAVKRIKKATVKKKK